MEPKRDWRYSVGFVGETPFQIRVDWVRPESVVQYLWDDERGWFDTIFQSHEFQTMNQVIEAVQEWINSHG